METKVCTICNIEKPDTFEYFPKNSKGKTINQCKPCKNIYLKEYKRKHKTTPYDNVNRRLRVDLTGMKFNYLMVLGKSHRDISKRMYWKCLCDCGNITVVQGYALSKNRTISCRECGTRRSTEKNTSHGSTKSRLYYTWVNMKTRCSNPNYEMYKNYGGKGIKVSEEWFDFENFKSWSISNGYVEGLTIDRIDNSKDYEPSNCRWSTMKEQQNNRTNNKIITYNNVALTLKQLSERFCISYSVLQRRMGLGWDVERALFTPVRGRSK